MQLAPDKSPAAPVTRRSDACRREPSRAPKADASPAFNPANLPALALEKIIHGMAPQALVHLGLASSATLAAVCAVNASAQQILLQAVMRGKDSKSLLRFLSGRWAQTVLPHCDTLTLADLRVKEGLARALLTALRPAQGLRRLDLRDNHVHGAALCRALSALPPLPHLQALSLRACRLPATALRWVTGSTGLRGLTCLDLTGNCLCDEGLMAAGFAKPAWTQLRALHLNSCGLKSRDFKLLSAATWCSSLHLLEMCSNFCGDQDARVVAASAHLSALESLDLRCYDLGEPGTLALWKSPNLCNLTYLEPMWNDRWDTLTPKSSNELLSALSHASWRRQLANLYFPRANISAHQWACLAQTLGASLTGFWLNADPSDLSRSQPFLASSCCARLRSLGLRMTGDTTSDELASWLKTPQLTALQELKIIWDVGDLDLTALAGATQLSSLTHLQMSVCEGWRFSALSALTYLRDLQKLRLTSGLRDDELHHLLREIPLGKLAHLHLAWGRLTDRGVGHLAAATDLRRLTYLNLSHNKLGDQSALWLSRAPQFGRLRSLKLSNNGALGTAGISALSESIHLTGLTKLGLNSAALDDEAMRRLTRASRLSGLQDLSLNDASFGDASWGFLAQAHHFLRLRRLRLANSGSSSTISSGAFVRWTPEICLPQLQVLSLYGHGVDDAAALALMSAPGLPSLLYISYDQQALSEPVRARMEKRFGWKDQHF